MEKQKWPMSLDDVFSFGKHNGDQVEDVTDDDPDYIAWLIENEICEFDEEAMRVIEHKKII